MATSESFQMFVQIRSSFRGTIEAVYRGNEVFHTFFATGFDRNAQKLSSSRSFTCGAIKEPQIAGIKDIIAVASGKGGVGKSTTAVNLAVALADKCHLKVGLLDADVYGPSVPTMMKIHGKPEVNEGLKMIPVENYGVKCMSMGLLIEKDNPVIWRGPMVMSALEKMTRGVDWGALDILVVDMPPGTGDAQLSISQRLQLAGALIVSTSQDVALMDARRGARMFLKVKVPLLGIVENMSYFTCPHCDQRSHIFGEGGVRRTAEVLGLDYLGGIPLEEDIRKCSDDGVPVVVSAPNLSSSSVYTEIAVKIASKLEELEKHAPFHRRMSLRKLT